MFRILRELRALRQSVAVIQDTLDAHSAVLARLESGPDDEGSVSIRIGPVSEQRE